VAVLQAVLAGGLRRHISPGIFFADLPAQMRPIHSPIGRHPFSFIDRRRTAAMVFFTKVSVTHASGEQWFLARKQENEASCHHETNADVWLPAHGVVFVLCDLNVPKINHSFSRDI
jgi:hypothetical protein